LSDGTPHTLSDVMLEPSVAWHTIAATLPVLTFHTVTKPSAAPTTASSAEPPRWPRSPVNTASCRTHRESMGVAISSWPLSASHTRTKPSDSPTEATALTSKTPTEDGAMDAVGDAVGGGVDRGTPHTAATAPSCADTMTRALCTTGPTNRSSWVSDTTRAGPRS
jgi:hypothetical protein